MNRKKLLEKPNKGEEIFMQRKQKKQKKELIDKSSLIYICTSECRYRPKASVLLVSKQKFNEEHLLHLILYKDTKSIDGNFYICKACRHILMKTRTPSCNEKKY